MAKKEENKWYALYTKSRYEKKTGQLLSEIGFEVYVPLLKTIKQWSDRKKKVEEPLFRSYIFIKTTTDKFHIARSVEGAVYIVSFNREPAVIQEEQIKSLQLLLDSEEKFDLSQEEFATGDTVEVMQGSLRGLKGTFVDYRGKKHILLRIDAINQSIVVHIPPLWVKKVCPQ
jgi:transcription antitermination factor NusG